MHTYHVIMIKETFAFKTDMRITELEIGFEMTSDFDDQCALALGITASDCSLSVELNCLRLFLERRAQMMRGITVLRVF